jgi:hypothetical protein
MQLSMRIGSVKWISSPSCLDEYAVPGTIHQLRMIHQDPDQHNGKGLHIQHILKGLGMVRNDSAKYCVNLKAAQT